jgi:hypothetical protein
MTQTEVFDWRTGETVVWLPKFLARIATWQTSYRCWLPRSLRRRLPSWDYADALTFEV